MTTRSDSSNAAVRAVLTTIGQRRDAAVLGLAPGDLKGQKIKAALFEEFGGQCGYCQKDIGGGFDVDHLVPINKQSLGLHMYGNLVPACNSCNSAKKNKSLGAFLEDSKITNAKTVQRKLSNRAAKYGANLDSQKIQELIENLYRTISETIFKESERAFNIFASPTTATMQAAKQIQRKSEYDFSDFSQSFPIGSCVQSLTDGSYGEICDYSLQGPKHNRKPYVTYQPVGGAKPLRRAPGTLKIIKCQ
jgi:hypothetical protein